MPVHGAWKSELRLHTGNDIVGLPVFFPADPAIPAPAIAAHDQFTRTFVLDKHLLQREQALLRVGLAVEGEIQWFRAVDQAACRQAMGLRAHGRSPVRAPEPGAASTDAISCVSVLRATFSHERQPPP